MSLNALAGLFAHDVGNADPVIEFFGRDDGKNCHAATCIGRPECGKPHRIEALGCVVQDDQKLTHVDPSKFGD